MKTIKQFLIYTTTAVLFAATGCIEDFDIRGNGVSASEGRIAPNFNKVISSGSFDIHITHGDTYEVVVRAEENILPYIETRVSGESLIIDIPGIHSIRNRLPMEVFITTPYIDAIKQSGSGIITTDYFETDHFDAVISGSGSITTSIDAHQIDAIISGSGVLNISGNSNEALFLISGSGKIAASDCEVTDCKATISGSGNLFVSVERFLKATISGSGNVLYHGNPDVEIHISGSGKVLKNN